MADAKNGAAGDSPVAPPGLTVDEAWSVLLARLTPPSRTKTLAASAREAARGFVREAPRAVPRLLLTSGIAFGLGWVLNVWVLAYQYDGFRTAKGAPVTGQGSRAVGALFWMLLASMVTATVSYRLRVGKDRFREDIVSAPARLRSMVRQDSDTLLVHLLWGFGAGMALSVVTGTALLFLGGLAFVGGIATFARGPIVALVSFVWRTVARRVAPSRRRGPTPGAMVVAALGALLASFTNGIFTVEATRVAVAVAACGIAYVLSRQRSDAVVAPRAAVVAVALCAGAALAFSVAPAAADDGGAIECPTWPQNCPGVGKVFGEGLLGGLAALVGALAGEGVGRAAGEDDDDWVDDCGGSCPPPEGDDDDEMVAVFDGWEWVEGDPLVEAADWKQSNPGRSLKEYNEAEAWKRVEQSRQAALAKAAQIDRLGDDLDDLQRRLAKMESDVNNTLSQKPWSELSNAERQQTKRQLISDMKARGMPQGEIERVVGVLEQGKGMSSADFATYFLGEIVRQTPGETWKAGNQTIDTVIMQLKNGFIGNLAAAYAEDVASGRQAARLTDPFKTAWDYYANKTPAQVQADFNEVAKVTGNQGMKITQKQAAAFIQTVEKLHQAQVSGNVPAVAQPVAKFIGGEISEEILQAGFGKAMNLGKAGLSLIGQQIDIARINRAINKADAAVPPGAGTAARSADITDYVKAPDGTALDTKEKLAQFGVHPNEAKAAQRISDEEGVILDMRPGGADRARQLEAGSVGQKGQYNHSNTVKSEDLLLGVGFREEDLGLAGGLTQEMYDTLRDPKHFASLSPVGQQRAQWRMKEYVDRAPERAKLAQGKFERVADPSSPSGRKTVLQQRVRDGSGVDRDPVTGLADTGDWDIGDIRLPDRAFFHDVHGKPLTNWAQIRQDYEKYITVVKRMMNEVGVAPGMGGSVRHPGGYWKPKVKLIRNKKTGILERNCADLDTKRRIHHENSISNPNAKANMQFTPGGDTPKASYNKDPKPRYDSTYYKPWEAEMPKSERVTSTRPAGQGLTAKPTAKPTPPTGRSK